jgi:hypothetical protein
MSHSPRALPLACLMTIALCATSRGEALVNNPKYREWANFKPGAFVSIKSETHTGARVVTTELTETLIEVKSGKITVEEKANFQGTSTTNKVVIPAKVPKSEATAVDDPGVKAQETKSLPVEDVTVAGKSYKCKVMEFTGKNDDGADVSGKIWTCTIVPGRLVKSEIHIGDPTPITYNTFITAVGESPTKP